MATQTEYQRLYYLANRERIRARNQLFYNKNREQILARKKEWKNFPENRARYLGYAENGTRRYHLKHPSKRKALSRSYHARNKKRLNARRTERYRNDSPEAKKRRAAYLRKYRERNRIAFEIRWAKRRALKRTASVDVTGIKEWIERIKAKPAFRCYYCDGLFSTFDLHIDHVGPLSKNFPHSISNICASCVGCNLSKQDKMLSEWKRLPQIFLQL